MRKPFCIDGRLMIADPQWDDPLAEVDLGECEDCDCERELLIASKEIDLALSARSASEPPPSGEAVTS